MRKPRCVKQLKIKANDGYIINEMKIQKDCIVACFQDKYAKHNEYVIGTTKDNGVWIFSKYMKNMYRIRPENLLLANIHKAKVDYYFDNLDSLKRCKCEGLLKGGLLYYKFITEDGKCFYVQKRAFNYIDVNKLDKYSLYSEKDKLLYCYYKGQVVAVLEDDTKWYKFHASL